MFDGLLRLITGLFDVVLSLILGGCQLMGSIILFMFLFIVFILIGFAVVVLLMEYRKQPNEIFKRKKADDLLDYLDEQRKGNTDD